VATVAACYVLWVISRSLTGRNPLSGSAIILIILLFVRSETGMMMYVLLLAPVRVQIAHLFAADAPWILLVLASDLVLEAAKEGQTR
jgi:hypothetical protein